MIKDRVERIFRRIGAETFAVDRDRVGYAVIYPMIDKSDFSDKVRQEIGCVDEECFVMLCPTELVDSIERGEKIICRGESYAILSRHIISVGEIGIYAQCYLKRFIK